jgi:ActR/RegA family two-component response regulator
MHDPILVVDDDPMLLAVIAREIGVGFNPILVQSYKEAIDLLSTATPWRAVICDLDLRHAENGLAVFRLARALVPAAFRILISGLLSDVEAARLIVSGDIHAFVAKPWPMYALRNLLTERLGGTP